MTIRAAVFASGRGSNFQVLVEHASEAGARSAESSAAGAAPAWEVVLLVTDREEAYALERARDLGVESVVVSPTADPRDFGARLLTVLDEARVQMVLNAGYLRLVPSSVVQRYHGRMLNLHPALLPSFGGKGMYGRRVHEAVLDSGVRLSGVTVHFVNEEYDRGQILAQWPVPVIPGDTPETLAARIHDVEHRLFPAAADRLARAIVDGSEPSPIPSPGVRFDIAEHILRPTGAHPESHS